MNRKLLFALFTAFLLCVGISMPQNTLASETAKVPEHIIDLDAAPFTPRYWSVEEHRKGGQFKWNPDFVELYLSNKQKSGGFISYTKLREEIKDKLILNANVLDYLLAHPYLIPERWKHINVVFWGTVYRNQDNRLSVRYLSWGDWPTREGSDSWSWNFFYTADNWGARTPAALLLPGQAGAQ